MPLLGRPPLASEMDSARFDRMQREWENQRRDPDDVFFAANDRKREIKEQIKELQKGLERQRSDPRERSGTGGEGYFKLCWNCYRRARSCWIRARILASGIWPR
jgi:hypothetical protein